MKRREKIRKDKKHNEYYVVTIVQSSMPIFARFCTTSPNSKTKKNNNNYCSRNEMWRFSWGHLCML